MNSIRTLAIMSGSRLEENTEKNPVKHVVVVYGYQQYYRTLKKCNEVDCWMRVALTEVDSIVHVCEASVAVCRT